MEFVEAPAFTQRLQDYLDDEGYRSLQTHLSANPTAGDLVAETGGFRKVRWPDPRRGKGKREGLRVIYYLFLEDSVIWFITVYDKDEMEDLTAEQKKALKKAIDNEKAAREARKKRTRR